MFRRIFLLIFIISVFIITGCSAEQIEEQFNVIINNSPKSVVIDNPYVIEVIPNQDAYLSLYLNDKEVYKDKEIKGKVSNSIQFSFEKSRGNSLRIEIRNKKGEILEYKYENILFLPKVQIVVDKNYQGEEGMEINGRKYFKSVKNAITYIMLNQSNYNNQRVYVFVRSGDYYEKVNIGFPNVSLIGEDVNTTKI